MAATDYAGMKSRWQDALATDDTDADFMARLPALIGDSELRIYRDLDPTYCRKMGVAVTMTPGTATVSLPTDCWIPRRLVLLTGTSKATLLQRQASYLDELWPDPALTGTPRYWAIQVEGTAQLAPTPTTGFTLRADYTYRPATLSASNSTTWLATNYPDLLYSAGMVWLQGWTKNYGSGDDPQGAGYWTKEYERQLNSARIEESRKKGEPAFEPGPVPVIPAPGG